MISLNILIVLLIISIVIIWYYKKVGRKALCLKNCPSIPCKYPFVGNVPLFTQGKLLGQIHPDLTCFLVQGMHGLTKLFKEIFVFWMGWTPMVVIYTPELVEAVLSSNKVIEKSHDYDLLHPWLGRGLLTNFGDKWRTRRKLLTPAFHFKIIDDFIPVMNEHSFLFVERLKQITDGAIDDLSSYVTACTLDIICDTAMGVKINAQSNSNSDYVRSVYILGESFIERSVDIRGWFDTIYLRTESGKQYLKSLNTLHEFTRKVILQRKEEIIQNKSKSVLNDSKQVFGLKKRMAFLDLLLQHHLEDNSRLSLEDIREEVDTFMFEGHDTTAMAICWALYLIGLDPEVQNKVHSEIDSVFGDDKSRPVTSDDLSNLKYIECCVKEALRLYPSVTMFARLVDEDFKLKSYTLPKGTGLMIFPYALHRNNDVFPKSERFIPERFGSERSETKLNPYSYIPFSAGPRNCIGQRFALTEEKIVLANVFRNLKIKSLEPRDWMKPAFELVTRPKHPIKMQFNLK